MSFRAQHSEAKNLEDIHLYVTEILPPYDRLNDKKREA